MAKKPTYEELVQRVKELKVELKRAEEELKESEKRFQSFYNTAPLPYQALDENGYFLDVNPSCVEELGYSREEVLGKWFGDFLVPEYVDQFRQIFPRFKAAGKIYGAEFEILRKDGSTIIVSYNGKIAYDKEGRFKQTHCVFQNITARKQAEEALRESEERYSSFVHKFQGIAFSGKMDFTPIFFHGAVEEITGYTEDEFVAGKPRWNQIIHSDDLPTVFTEDEKKLHSVPNYSYEREYRIVRKDGQIRLVHEVIQNICDDSGKPTMVQGSIYDITERRRAEEVLRESELRLRYLSFQLISAQEEERKRISLELHDEMGQVLTAVGINLESIGKELAPEHAAMIKDKLAETISLVEQASDRVRDLSLDLRPSMLDDLGLLPTLRWYINSYEKRTETPVIFETVNLGERLAPEVEIALYRIVQESLNNITKHALAKKVKIRFEQKKKKVGILIEDDGIGFYPERVMNETTPVKGIGLLGMQERVRLLEGSFRVRSHKGQGTSIFVELPLH